MSQAEVSYAADLSGEGLRIGIVQARFNQAITDQLREACVAECLRLGVAAEDLDVFSVPGALEIPLALQTMVQSDEWDALIAIGCVIRGDTYHFEIVCNESARGITEVALRMDIPVVNGVLTVESEAQAQARLGKGAEAARVAIEMALFVENLREE